MATNLQIDDQLIEDAVKLGNHKTKKAAVTQALIAYTQQLRQRKVKGLFGGIDFAADYDYKKQRSKQ